MKISIIVPVYNVETYVEGCLKSIQNQTFQDFECICVDDGSTDNSAAVVAAFCQKDSRFKLIRQENKKIGGARNTGLKAATGEVISFVDSDDYIHPQMLEIMLAVMEKENTPIVGCKLFNTSEKYSGKFADITDYHLKTFTKPFLGFATKRAVTTSVHSKLYKRSAIGNIRFIEGITFEDVSWTVENMIHIDKYVLIDAKLYYYYNNPHSIMRTFWNNQKTDSYVTVINYVYNFLAQNYPQHLKTGIKHIFNQRIKMIFNRIAKCPKAEQKALYDYASQQIKLLFADKKISYSGLKIKHRITLWKMLHAK